MKHFEHLQNVGEFVFIGNQQDQWLGGVCNMFKRTVEIGQFFGDIAHNADGGNHIIMFQAGAKADKVLKIFAPEKYREFHQQGFDRTTR